MAGGMGRRGTWGPMSERVKQGRENEPTPPTIKHCWVNGRHGRMPGLLLEWRRGAGGYSGRVVHAVLENGEWLVVEEWLPAELLESANAPR